MRHMYTRRAQIKATSRSSECASARGAHMHGWRRARLDGGAEVRRVACGERGRVLVRPVEGERCALRVAHR
eukprot:6188004-Pleurochrysis_carterae.AAC.9